MLRAKEMPHVVYDRVGFFGCSSIRSPATVRYVLSSVLCVDGRIRQRRSNDQLYGTQVLADVLKQSSRNDLV